MNNSTKPRMRSMFNLAYDRGMDMYDKGKSKKNFIMRTWKRCKSIPRSVIGNGESSMGKLPKSKSWHSGDNCTKRQVAPEGCFSVYVGVDKQKFAIKTEYANHPLFEMLLEEAELEYGYNSEGPILLACDVNMFYRVLAEMEMGNQEREDEMVVHGSCGFAYGTRSPFKAGRHLGKCVMGKGWSSYGSLTPSRVIKMN